MLAGSLEEKAIEICRLYDQMSSRRGTWESHWQEIADRIYPLARENFETKWAEKGNKRNEEIFDSTAATALNRFAAILESLLNPRNATWHRLVPSEPELNKDRSVRLWFEEVNRLTFKYRYAPSANFTSQNQQDYKSLGAFGTSAIFIDGLYESPGLRYKSCHLGEIFPSENHQGLVDKVLRKFSLTARQAMLQFGDANADAVKKAVEKDENREFDFIHYVCPNEEYDPSRADFRGMLFSSYYVSISEKKPLSQSGFNSFPFAISRYEQALGEVYGRSPAMDVLPAIKSANEMKKTLLKQGHRAVDPVLLAHDDGVLDQFSLRPGAVNYGGVSKDGRSLVQALPVGSVAAGQEMIEEERNIIRDNFLLTIFQILTETPQMTATEVMERTREKGLLLAPTLGRQQSERLGPMIEREVDLLSMQGLLPPLPQALIEAGADYKVEYDSPLSRAQRAEEASGLMRTVESALNVVNATQDPSVLDHFNWDVIIPELAEINAVPASWRKSEKEIQALRQSRAEQAQAQQAVDAAPNIAQLAKASGAVPGAK